MYVVCRYTVSYTEIRSHVCAVELRLSEHPAEKKEGQTDKERKKNEIKDNVETQRKLEKQTARTPFRTRFVRRDGLWMSEKYDLCNKGKKNKRSRYLICPHGRGSIFLVQE